MASVAEIPRFEEMIESVAKFIVEVSEACNQLTVAGKECVENCDNDVPSTKSNEKLTGCVKKFNEALETAQRVKDGLQYELERLREIIRRSESFADD